MACIVMNGPLREGLPLDNTLADRIAFIANNGLLWSLSWCFMDGICAWVICILRDLS